MLAIVVEDPIEKARKGEGDIHHDIEVEYNILTSGASSPKVYKTTVSTAKQASGTHNK